MGDMSKTRETSELLVSPCLLETVIAEDVGKRLLQRLHQVRQHREREAVQEVGAEVSLQRSVMGLVGAAATPEA
jgi:hypothetical protein